MSLLDAIAGESHFVDHLAPVWQRIPASERGRFLVARPFLDRARAKGIDATAIDANAIRATAQHPPNLAGQPALVASIGDIKIGRRLGYGPFAFLEHGAGQAYDSTSAVSASYAGGPDRDDNELILAPNDYSGDKWRKAYPQARVEVVGCPKVEDLPAREPGPGPVVAVSFHWPAPMVLTGYAGTAFGDFREKLPALAKRFRVIGHEHPNWTGLRFAGPPSKTYAKLGVPFVEDFEDVCRQADVYVCDNSSTMFEFAATGRPVVVLNARWWSRKGGPGLRFWDAAHVGVNVGPDGDLVAAVEEALEDAPQRQVDREDALGFVYAYRSGAAERASMAIRAWMANRDSPVESPAVRV